MATDMFGYPLDEEERFRLMMEQQRMGLTPTIAPTTTRMLPGPAVDTFIDRPRISPIQQPRYDSTTPTFGPTQMARSTPTFNTDPETLNKALSGPLGVLNQQAMGNFTGDDLAFGAFGVKQAPAPLPVTPPGTMNMLDFIDKYGPVQSGTRDAYYTKDGVRNAAGDLVSTDPTGGAIDQDMATVLSNANMDNLYAQTDFAPPVTDQQYINEGTIPPGADLDYSRVLAEEYGGPALEATSVSDPLETLAERAAVIGRHPDIGYPSAIGTSFGDAGVDMNTPFGVQFSGFPTAEEQALAEPILSPLDIIGGGTPAAARFIGKQVSKLGPLLERTLSGPFDAAKRATLEKLGAGTVKAAGLDFDPLLKDLATSGAKKADEIIDVMVDVPVGAGGVRFEKYNLASKRFVSDEIDDFLSKKAQQFSDAKLLPSNPHLQGFPTDKSVMQTYMDNLPVSTAKKASQTTSKPYGDYPPGWVGGPLSVAPMSIGDPTISGLVAEPTVSKPAPPAGPSAADVQRDKQAAVDARLAQQAAARLQQQQQMDAEIARQAEQARQAQLAQAQSVAQAQAQESQRRALEKQMQNWQGRDEQDESAMAQIQAALDHIADLQGTGITVGSTGDRSGEVRDAMRGVGYGGPNWT